MLGNKVARPVKKPSTGEWYVRWISNGKTDENKSYYTDDMKDAYDTYARMLKNAEEENKGITPDQQGEP